MKKILTALLLVFGVTLSVAACSTTSQQVGLAEGTVIIDVRTPGEFASGHLEGALNIDVQSPDFAAQVSQLDPTQEYFIYCRSGNRSGYVDKSARHDSAAVANAGLIYPARGDPPDH